MNLSGNALRAAQNRERPAYKFRRDPYAVTAEDELVVIMDDLDIPFGRLKIGAQNLHSPHNGIRSINSALKNKS